MVHGGLPFPVSGCPVPDAGNIYLINEMIDEMINVYVSDTDSVFIRLPNMFLSTAFLLEKRIGQVTMDLRYIRFTY